MLLKAFRKYKYIIPTGDPSSIHLVISSKHRTSLLSMTSPLGIRVVMDLCIKRKFTIWSLINISNNLQNTDVKRTGL